MHKFYDGISCAMCLINNILKNMYSPYIYNLLIINIFYLTRNPETAIMGTNETAPTETKALMIINRLTKFTVIANSSIMESEGLLYP
jgi:hypothetical protein